MICVLHCQRLSVCLQSEVLNTLMAISHFLQVFGTPTVRSVINHKWRLYGRQRLTIRASVYAVFTVIFTAFAVMYAQEDRTTNIAVRIWQTECRVAHGWRL